MCRECVLTGPAVKMLLKLIDLAVSVAVDANLDASVSFDIRPLWSAVWIDVPIDSSPATTTRGFANSILYIEVNGEIPRDESRGDSYAEKSVAVRKRSVIL